MATASVGTVFKIGTSAVGELSSISGPAPSADTIDTTALDNASGYKTFIQSFKDGGEVSLEGFFNYEDAGQAALIAAFESGAASACSVVFPEDIGQTLTFSAIVTGYEIGTSVEDAITFSVTLKVSGAFTWAETA